MHRPPKKERRDEPNAISVKEIALKLRAKDALEHRLDRSAR